MPEASSSDYSDDNQWEIHKEGNLKKRNGNTDNSDLHDFKEWITEEIVLLKEKTQSSCKNVENDVAEWMINKYEKERKKRIVMKTEREIVRIILGADADTLFQKHADIFDKIKK